MAVGHFGEALGELLNTLAVVSQCFFFFVCVGGESDFSFSCSGKGELAQVQKPGKQS